MSRMRGFAAYEGIAEADAFAPALQLLHKEHVKLRKGMEAACRFALKASKKPEQSAAEEWMNKEQKLRADWKAHVLKEERGLLVLLANYVEGDRGPLAVMRYEHERLETLFNEFEAQMQKLLADSTDLNAWRDAMSLFSMISKLQGDHCYKEEKTIYALAQSVLTDVEKTQLFHHLRKMK